VGFLFDTKRLKKRFIIMKIFDPTNTIHTLKIIPRNYVTTATMVLRNELRQTETSHALTCTNTNGYLTAEFTQIMAEGQNFEFEVYDTNNNLLYRGKAYATNTTI
jgi:hypothetical protein